MSSLSSYSREYQKAYYQEHREKYREYYRKYARKNRARLTEKTAKLKQQNKEKYGPEQAWIKEARIERGLGRKKFAKLLGCTTSAVYQYETGMLKAPTERIKEVLCIA